MVRFNICSKSQHMFLDISEKKNVCVNLWNRNALYLFLL